MKKHMGRLFVQVVAANPTERVTVVNDEEEYRGEEAARRTTVDAARDLLNDWGKPFERVWKTSITVEDELFSVLVVVTCCG